MSTKRFESYEKAIMFRTANHPALRGIQKGAIALFCVEDTPFEPQSAKPLPRLIFSSHDLANPRPLRPCPSLCKCATGLPVRHFCESATSPPPPASPASLLEN